MLQCRCLVGLLAMLAQDYRRPEQVQDSQAGLSLYNLTNDSWGFLQSLKPAHRPNSLLAITFLDVVSAFHLYLLGVVTEFGLASN
jgi:hypothetical protein